MCNFKSCDGEIKKMNKEINKEFGQSANGNYIAWDTIGVPHTFVIGVKHVNYAHDNHGGMLGEDTMEAVPCSSCKEPLSKHKTALLVNCKVKPENNNKFGKELKSFLKKIVPKIEKAKYEGVTLMDGFSK